MAKTTCTVSRSTIRTKAAPMLAATIAGQHTPCMLKSEGFSTGSEGWNYSGKIVVEIDGVPTVCQVGINVTIVGSKELPQA